MSNKAQPADLPKVIKRDGKTIQPWEPEKLRKAIGRAFMDVGKEPNGELDTIIAAVGVEANRSGDGFIPVTKVQHIVKTCLMQHDPEVAESYIVFASRRDEARNNRLSFDTSAVSDFVHVTRYGRYDRALSRREVFPESVSRVEAMFLGLFPDHKQGIVEAFDSVRAKDVLPSMRNMQFGGEAVLKHNAKNYNCAFSVCNRVEFFKQVFYLLLCGTGTGYSVQFRHVDQIPALGFIDKSNVIHHVVDDSIEGWANALDALIQSYYDGKYVEFSYHQIRDKGVPLKTSGGTAPGHIPLKKSLTAIRAVLDGAQGRQLRPIECHDIICHAADSVYAGGIREAALIALFSIDDGEMMICKTGNWLKTNPQRARANNSVVLLRSNAAKEQFMRIIKSTRQYGEPGFYFTDDLDYGGNPCLSGDSRLRLPDGSKTLRQLWVDGGMKEYRPEASPDELGTLQILNAYGEATATNVYRTSKGTDVYRVQYKDGGWNDVTSNHTFKVVLPNGPTVKRKTHELSVGDVVPLSLSEGFGTAHDPHYAQTAGWVIGDGSVYTDGTQQGAILRFWNDDLTDAMPVLRNNVSAVYEKHNLSSEQNPQYVGTDGSTEGFEGMVRKDIHSRVIGRLLRSDGVTPGYKHIVPESIWGSDEETVAAFLRGLFSADGHPEANYAKKCISIRLTQRTDRIELLHGVQQLLTQFGIPSVISKPRKPSVVAMNDGKGGKKDYTSRGTRRLIISGIVNVKAFMDRIGFVQSWKCDIAHSWLSTHAGSNNSTSAVRRHREIVNISHIGIEETFCLTEFGHNELIVNSTEIGNCVEITLNPRLKITPSIRSEINRWAKTYNKAVPKIEVGDVYWGWQMCVSGDTPLITRHGIVRNIKDAVGVQTTIWNGKNWRPVTPFITGRNQKLYRVNLSDGSHLDCTIGHRWDVINNGKAVEMTTAQLSDHLATKSHRSVLQLPRQNVTHGGGVPERMAYEYGFFLGDGWMKERWDEGKKSAATRVYKYAYSDLFGEKIKLPLRGTRSPQPNDNGSVRIKFDLDASLCEKMKSTDGVVDQVFTWDRRSIKAFVAGWADADGSKTNGGCRIYGTPGRIADLQMLLTKAGIVSSVNPTYEKGEHSNIGRRNKAMWYVQVSGVSDLPTNRFDSKCAKEASNSTKWQRVESVVELPGLHTTYCVKEADRHRCMFGNVVTFQCNLTTINVATATDATHFLRSAKHASVIGTLQASFTSFPYMGWVTEFIVWREALLGVSMTGILDNPAIGLNPELLRQGSQVVVDTNIEWAEKLGINSAARTTCCKPEGSSSKVLKVVGHGIHAHHARRYFMRIRSKPNDPAYQYFKSINPHMCTRESDVKEFITFPITAPDSAVIRSDLTEEQFLDNVFLVQKNWVMPGTAKPDSSPGACNNVSNTCNVRDDMWEHVANIIWRNRAFMTGISLMPWFGDKDFPNAPQEEVINEADEAKWNHIVGHYKKVDWSAFVETSDNTTLITESGCAGGACLLQ